MDIQMPDMDGVTATREIRQRLGDSCPPVVAMTAYSMQEDAGRFMRQGLDDYVGKPVKSRHLYEVLHRWLRPRQNEAAQRALAAQNQPEPAPAPPVVEEQAAPAIATPAPALAIADASPAQPTLDTAVLQQLVELGGPEFTADLYQEFEQEAGELLREGAQLVKAGEFRSLLPLLHQLKGTSATLGGTAIAAQARHLEHELKENRPEGTPEGFKLLEHYFAAFVAEYPLAVGAAANTSPS